MGTTEQDFPDRDPQLMYEVATNRLATQLSFIDAIDSKIAMLVSMASAILGIAAAVFALHAIATTTTAAGATKAVGLSGSEIATLAVGAVIYMVVVWFGMRAYFCRDWHVGPSLRALMKQHKGEDSDRKIRWGVAVDTWLDFEANLPMYNTKEKALRAVFVGAALETLALVAAISLVAAGA